MQNLLNLAWVTNGNHRIHKAMMMTGLLSVLMLAGCEEAGDLWRDQKKIVRQVDLEPRDAIWTYGLFDIRLVQDTTYKLVIRGYREVVNNIHVSQNKRKTTVSEDFSNHWYSGKSKPVLEYHFVGLRYCRIEEPSRLSSPDTIHSNHLEVIVANELSEIDLVVDAGYLYLENWTTNTGNYSFRGKAHHYEVELHGSGRLQADSLHTKNAVIRQQSIGDIHIRTNDTLQVHSSGSGDVFYYGEPAEIIFEQSASGDLIGLDS